jgi:hypothetical protein
MTEPVAEDSERASTPAILESEDAAAVEDIATSASVEANEQLNSDSVDDDIIGKTGVEDMQPSEESTVVEDIPVVARKSQPEAPTIAESTPRETSSNQAQTAAVTSPASGNIDILRDQLLTLAKSDKLDKGDAKRLSVLIKEYDGLKDKVSKIKSLLGRSAKAQREAKVDLEVTQKRLDQALREVDRLQSKIDKLANRPTHMELLADFETNFDRALLSVHQQASSSSSALMEQSGGQDTAPPHQRIHQENSSDASSFMDNLLLQEVQDAKARVEKLELLNQTLAQRSNALEESAKQSKRDRDELAMQVKHLELEKRMATMEAEHATKALQDKSASLAEMQLEIDLVTKASASANARAAHGEELVKHVKTDRQHVLELESRVSALQEWALAANEAKMLAQERVRLLETQLRTLQNSQQPDGGSALESSSERVIFSYPGSLVVGAGDRGCHVVELSVEDTKTVKQFERVILRWRFDLVQDDAQIDFSILKSKCETKQKQNIADYIVKDRLVVGGAAGETENAFAIQNSCTLLWCNTKAWVRPKTVRFNVEAVVLED